MASWLCSSGSGCLARMNGDVIHVGIETFGGDGGGGRVRGGIVGGTFGRTSFGAGTFGTFG